MAARNSDLGMDAPTGLSIGPLRCCELGAERSYAPARLPNDRCGRVWPQNFDLSSPRPLARLEIRFGTGQFNNYNYSGAVPESVYALNSTGSLTMFASHRDLSRTRNAFKADFTGTNCNLIFSNQCRLPKGIFLAPVRSWWRGAMRV